MSTAIASKLSARQARALHDADVAAKKLRAQLEAAEGALSELRDRYRDRIPLSDDVDEAAKGIRVTIVGGVSIRIAPAVSSDSFSLKRYREAGHQITPEMRDAVSPGRPYDRWTVKPAGGPKKLGAVEPT